MHIVTNAMKQLKDWWEDMKDQVGNRGRAENSEEWPLLDAEKVVFMLKIESL